MKNNLFILIPCHLGQDAHVKMTDIKDNDFAKEYIKVLKDITDSEIVNRVGKTFDRAFLGNYQLPIYSDSGIDQNQLDETHVDMFITKCHKNHLAVLTLIIHDYEGNISHIIDQVTREDIYINKQSLYDFLLEHFDIIKNGEAKMILTQDHLQEEDITYYMATETSASSLVDTKIVSEKYQKYGQDNIAVYDFSDIYASESLVYQVLKGQNNQLQYQGLLVFIVEILVMQLSAIYRTNNKITNALEENQKLKTKDYEKFSIEFANTLSIWQIDIYRYKGAQTIANKISERFGIQSVLNNYKQNDAFLQNIINTNNVKNSEFESWILFVIAILLFFKELFVITKSIVGKMNEGSSLSELDIISTISSTSIIIILIIIVYFIRKRTIEN